MITKEEFQADLLDRLHNKTGGESPLGSGQENGLFSQFLLD